MSNLFDNFLEEDDDYNYINTNNIDEKEITECSFAISKDLVYKGVPNKTKYYTYQSYLKIIDYFDPPIQVDSVGINKLKENKYFIGIFGDFKLPVIMKVSEKTKKSLLLQPAQKSCVVSSFAMVYYDKFSDKNLTIRENINSNENIKTILENSANQTSCTSIEKINFYGLPIFKITIVFLNIEDLYNILEKIFETKAFALLQPIESQEISGHQIVIDGVLKIESKFGILIRDSYNGIAGVVEIDKFLESLELFYKDNERFVSLDNENMLYKNYLDIIQNTKKIKSFDTYMVI